MFHREVLYISRDQFEELRAELWELSKAMLDARRRDTFYRNTSYCFQYGRPCAYFQLCRSGGNPSVAAPASFPLGILHTKSCGTEPAEHPLRCFQIPT